MRKSFQRIATTMMAGIIAIGLLSGCGNNNESTANNEKKNMTIAVTSFADTLEPTEQYFAWVVMRYGIGETLVKFDENGNLKESLATSWENSKDGCTWTLKIREGVKFSNGDDMTPEIVKESLERTFEKSDRASTFFEPKSIEVDGENLVIKTKKPVATLPGSLADPLFLIVNTKIDDSKFATEGPVCTGPYAVKEFEPTASCVVVRNEHYWEKEVPMESVEFKCIDDQATRSMALQSGEVDVAYNLKTENLVDFKDNENYQILNLKSLRSTYAFMNQNGVLADLNLRKAIIMGLDRESYVTNLLSGGATAGKAPVPPTLNYGFSELVDENAYDVEGAKKLLKESGYVDINGDGYVETKEGKEIDLQFVIYTSREELNIYAQAAQLSLKEIGIKVTLKVVSYETLLDLRDAGQYDLLIWNVLVANTGDPEKYLRENWYSTSSANTTGYSNKNVDAYLDELEESYDETKRKDLIIKIQQEIMNDAATIFFGYETTYLFASSKVQGLVIYPMDYYWLTSDVKMQS